MKGIFVGTGKEPFTIEFEDTLNNLQALVGGRIEVLSIKEVGDRSIDLIFNEECKFLYEEVNKFYVWPSGHYDYLSGNIIVLAADESTGEFCSLTDEEVEYYLTFMLDDKLFL
jgi:hypothetical protein